MKKLIALGAALALLGCGGPATPPPASTTTDVRTRALERVKMLDDQIAEGKVQSKDVLALITSLNFLAAHAKAEKIGTDARIAEVQSLAAELSQKAQGRTIPPADWRPSDTDAASAAGSGIDVETLKEMLPKIRDAVEAVK